MNFILTVFRWLFGGFLFLGGLFSILSIFDSSIQAPVLGRIAYGLVLIGVAYLIAVLPGQLYRKRLHEQKQQAIKGGKYAQDSIILECTNPPHKGTWVVEFFADKSVFHNTSSGRSLTLPANDAERALQIPHFLSQKGGSSKVVANVEKTRLVFLNPGIDLRRLSHWQLVSRVRKNPKLLKDLEGKGQTDIIIGAVLLAGCIVLSLGVSLIAQGLGVGLGVAFSGIGAAGLGLLGKGIYSLYDYKRISSAVSRS